MAQALKADPRAKGGLEVHVENVLDTDFIALRGAGAPLRVVGNLPYNISTPLLFRLLTQRAAISDMYFMLQKEVVDRMAAQPGSKDYGRLTVMLAAVAEVAVPSMSGRAHFNRARGVVRHRAFAAHGKSALRRG